MERFRAALDELASIKNVGASEKYGALFHCRVAEENFGTAAWRGGESVRIFVLREGTRHGALASLLVEKRLSFMNSSVTYNEDWLSPRLPRIDVMSFVAYFAAPERVKLMNPGNVVRAIRRYAIACNDETRDSSAAKITAAKGLKTSFFDALNDESTKHIMGNT